MMDVEDSKDFGLIFIKIPFKETTLLLEGKTRSFLTFPRGSLQPFHNKYLQGKNTHLEIQCLIEARESPHIKWEFL
jgi:hypothetical protein